MALKLKYLPLSRSRKGWGFGESHKLLHYERTREGNNSVHHSIPVLSQHSVYIKL